MHTITLVFIIVMAWILKQAIDGGVGGLDWLDGNKLADWDFADGIVLFDKLGVECNHSATVR